MVDVNPPGAPRKRRSESFKTKAEALDKVNEWQRAAKLGTLVDRSKQTLGEYLDQWLKGGALREWSGNTHTEYEVSVRLHIKPTLGGVALQSLTKVAIRALYGSLLKPTDPLAWKTVKNVHIALRAALNGAVEEGLLAFNPAVGALPKPQTSHREEMKTWTAEQVQHFLAFTADDPDGLLWRVALMTGMRRGELLGLRVSDLDLANDRLRVQQQLARDGKRGWLYKDLKNGTRSRRSIDLDPTTVALLRSRLADRKVVPLRDESAVFAGIDPYDLTKRRFPRAVRDAGLPVIRLHDLRHTHATYLLEQHVPLKYVAERLGDREDTVLNTYAHATPKMRSDAVSLLATLGG
jgi:integrase